MRYPPFQRFERRIQKCFFGVADLLLPILFSSYAVVAQNTDTGAIQGRVAANVSDHLEPVPPAAPAARAARARRSQGLFDSSNSLVSRTDFFNFLNRTNFALPVRL